MPKDDDNDDVFASGDKYVALETTYDVDGGTPVDALVHDLNAAHAAGYRFVGTVPVRSASGHGIWVHTAVFERCRDDD